MIASVKLLTSPISAMPTAIRPSASITADGVVPARVPRRLGIAFLNGDRVAGLGEDVCTDADTAVDEVVASVVGRQPERVDHTDRVGQALHLCHREEHGGAIVESPGRYGAPMVPVAHAMR
jgi:hypothetical protein